jgi:hypothetical protein
MQGDDSPLDRLAKEVADLEKRVTELEQWRIAISEMLEERQQH